MFNLSHHLCVLSETPCQTGAEATSVQHATGRFTTRRKCSVMARASINAVFSAVSTSNASKCKYNFIWNKTEQRSCHQRRPRRSRTALELCFASSGHLRKLALTFRSLILTPNQPQNVSENVPVKTSRRHQDISP